MLGCSPPLKLVADAMRVYLYMRVRGREGGREGEREGVCAGLYKEREREREGEGGTRARAGSRVSEGEGDRTGEDPKCSSLSMVSFLYCNWI